MNQWADAIHAVDQVVGTASDELQDIIAWFQKDIIGQAETPTERLTQIDKSFTTLNDILQIIAEATGSLAKADAHAVLTLLSRKRLSREELYKLLAMEWIESPNTIAGLTDFDDFELFDLLRYERDDRSGYIYVAADINEIPLTESDDEVLDFISRAYRNAIIAPEEIHWSTLTSEQRSFFKRYLPATVGRFLNESEPSDDEYEL